MKKAEDTIDCFVGLGSNIGNACEHLAAACQALALFPYVYSLEQSPIYYTEPQLVRDQNWFYNQVVRLHCAAAVTPLQVLDDLLALEKKLGRERTALRYGPRVIDLDLLLFEGVYCQTDRLVLPHPRLLERAFMLVPLNDLAPSLILPNGKTPQQTLSGLVHTIERNCIRQ